MAGKTYNNDIFKIIAELDKQHYNFFKSFNEAQYKELQPYTLLRWLSANPSESNIVKLNNVVNTRLFNLSENKDLLLNLLCACGAGHFVRHSWIPISKEAKVNKDDQLAKSFYNLNDEEYAIKKDSININDIKNYLGIQDKRK